MDHANKHWFRQRRYRIFWLARRGQFWSVQENLTSRIISSSLGQCPYLGYVLLATVTTHKISFGGFVSCPRDSNSRCVRHDTRQCASEESGKTFTLVYGRGRWSPIHVSNVQSTGRRRHRRLAGSNFLSKRTVGGYAVCSCLTTNCTITTSRLHLLGQACWL